MALSLDDEKFLLWMVREKDRSELTADLYRGMVRRMLREGAVPGKPLGPVLDLFATSTHANRRIAWNLYSEWCLGAEARSLQPGTKKRGRPRKAELYEESPAREEADSSSAC